MNPNTTSRLVYDVSSYTVPLGHCCDSLYHCHWYCGNNIRLPGSS